MSDGTESNGKLQGENLLDMRRSKRSNRDAGSVTLSRTATVVAIVVLIVYVAALLLLFVNRADKQWDRMVYLFSGYEAVVFVAVGAIFGTSVQRGAVQSAEARSHRAELEYQQARERADRAESEARSGQALANSIRGASRSRASGNGDRERGGARGGDALSPELELLARLADSLFPAER